MRKSTTLPRTKPISTTNHSNNDTSQSLADVLSTENIQLINTAMLVYKKELVYTEVPNIADEDELEVRYTKFMHLFNTIKQIEQFEHNLTSSAC